MIVTCSKSMSALPYAIPVFLVLHLWAMRQGYFFPEALGPPAPVREQPWAKTWFPATAGFFNLWTIYSLLNHLFVAPHGGWQLPPLLNNIGGILWGIAVVALTSAYTLHHFRLCIRAGGYPKVRVFHSIHGCTGLIVLGFVGYIVIILMRQMSSAA